MKKFLNRLKMRPTRGRPAAVGMNNRAKPCFVRLEKVLTKDDKDDEDDKKKLTGPIKKRPVVIKKSPVGRSKKTEIEDDLSGYNLVTARSRRTPKPNPKYSNDHIVSTSFKSRGRGNNSMDEDSDEQQEEDAGMSSDVEEQLSEEDEEEEEEDDSSEDEKMHRRSMIRSRVSSPQAKRGRGRPRMRYSPMNRRQTPDIEKSKRFEHLRKRKVDGNKQNVDESSILARNKRLNIELYDASDSDAPAMSPGGRRGRMARTTATTTASSSKTADTSERRIQSKAELSKRYAAVNQRAKRNDTDDESRRERSDIDDMEMTTGAASTIDDFETMPTFTIVNINDIINKKGDVLVSKSPNEEDSNASSQSSRNRRKSMHTTILSDKIDQSKLTPPPRSPFPPRKPTMGVNTVNNNNVSRSLVKSGSNDSFKSAPRILNSVVAKKTNPITPLVSKLATKDRDSDPDFSPIVGKSKENVHVNTYSGATSINRKLPTEKVLVQRQGNKLIKKITCFETWYVINIPPYETPNSKNNLDMSLTELGNISGEIALPSNLWNYKITLQKMSDTQIAKGNYEEFTGDSQDPNIPESEKHKYQPINIMFRRTNLNQRLRLPYDRAIIFKNKTYFINIDGKNVRLLGAPQTIQSMSEIETLLEIVDDMALGNQFVEQTTFIL